MSIKNAVKAYDYLRGHIDASVNQMVRLMERNDSHQSLIVRLQESAIDLKSSLQVVEDRTMTLEAINSLETVRKQTQKRFLEGKISEEQMHRELAHSVFEVAAAEIEKGGFHAHAIGTNGKVKVIKESRRVELARKGKYSYLFSAPINRWRDVTNIKIVPVKGV